MEPLLLPTRHKDKLPRHLSYPIGAQTLSKALNISSFFGAMSVAFLDRPDVLASEFQRVLKERLPYKILSAEYEPPQHPELGAPQFLIESGWYEEKWRLSVYPVLCELRQLANRLLMTKGLPYLIQSLQSAHQAGWKSRYHRLELVFSSATESLNSQDFCGV